jgi:hypothetical protein
MIDFIPTSYHRQNAWMDDLWLLTPEELDTLPAGTLLTSINADIKFVGHDYIDKDTRFGYTAWGVLREDFSHVIEDSTASGLPDEPDLAP